MPRPAFSLLAASVVVLAGCPFPSDGAEVVARGGLGLCLDDGRGTGTDLDLELDGTVTALTEGDAGCGTVITIDDGAGTVHTVGLLATDAEGAVDPPVLAIAEGASVHLLYRYRMVWGDVVGFVLSDEDGTVLAAEEGTWGGALEAGDVPGLTVTRGTEVLAREETDCEPIEGYSSTFAGDTSIELVPVAEGEVTVAGAPLTARAVAAWDWGEGDGCDVSDTTGATSWLVYR